MTGSSAGELFGTDGVRGRANCPPITAETVLRLAMAAGALFRRGDHRHTVVIGKDTRLSGYMLEPALTAGFTAMGMDVVRLGPIPTPAVGMLTRSLRADLGVMISASHNPYPDNGIKLFGADGFKLSRSWESEIERLMTAVRCGLPVVRALAGALALISASGGVQAAGPELINCYDADRGLVQRTLPGACTGEIVDAARAEALERQHRQARAARFRANQPTPQDRRRAERSGSAVFVSDQGHLVTARHVVDACRTIEVMLPDDRPVIAQVVRVAAEADLVVLKVAHQPVAIVRLAPRPGVNASANLGRGIREATAIGFPSLGRVVVRPVSTRAPVLGTKPLPPGPIPRLILQARVHPGHSGGPVVDPQGRLIGILIAKLDRAAVFARVGELPPDMAIAETGQSVSELMQAAGVPAAPIGGPGRGLQDALGASVRIECKP